MINEAIIASMVMFVFFIFIIKFLKKKEQSVACFILITFNVFFTSWLSTVLVVFFPDISTRLSGFSYNLILDVYYKTSISILILFFGMGMYLYLYDHKQINLSNNAELDEAVRVINPLYIAFFIYVAIKIVVFYKLSPLYLAALGQLEDAALARAAIQKGDISVDIPYLGKIFYFLAFYLTLTALILVHNNKEAKLKLVSVIVLASLQLTFDGQKASLFLLFMMVTITYFILSKSFLKLFLLFFSFMLIAGSLYSFMMSGGGNPLLRALDRSIFGQAQGMYYIMEYYEPQLTGIFSDLPFSHLLGLKELKPDEWIIPYIYSDSAHVVNSNTYIVGEMWAYAGDVGIFVFSFIVLFCLISYLLFFKWLYSFNRVIYWPIAMIFFSMLPINQSLQFIIYQKYFLYILFFLVIPISIVHKRIRL